MVSISIYLYAMQEYEKDKVVVNDIWLSIPKGQLFGLLGVNGAG